MLSESEAHQGIVALLGAAFASQSALQTRLSQCQAQLNSQERLTRAALNELEQAFKGKLAWEDEVYTRFRLLLNAKKDRIAQLTSEDPVSILSTFDSESESE